MNEVLSGVESKLIHSGEPRPRVDGAVVMPIFQSSTYLFEGTPGYHDVRYIRLSTNPNQQALNEKIAALENTEAGLVATSGMAAISASLLSVLSAGDHLLALDCLYGGTHGLVTKDLTQLGITHTFIDGQNPDSWREALQKNTKAIYVETLTNPLLQMPDVEAVAEFAKNNDLVSMIDNTFASPINFRPADYGFDLVLESGTKYLNGHNDIVAGTVAGSMDRIRHIKHKLDHLGGSLDPHACFLFQRGLKTLAVRVRYQCESALHIAKFLSSHPAVERVLHPSLPEHPQHERAKSLLASYGAMISFEVAGGAQAADRFMKTCRVATLAPSLGGVETLIVRPAAAVHSGLSKEERDASGISDGLIRLSVGLETTADLIADFDRALA